MAMAAVARSPGARHALESGLRMKRLLLFSNTTGYQAQMFRQAAERMAVPLALATDPCHMLDDPRHDRALAGRFLDDLRERLEGWEGDGG